jgi:agmatinase
LKNFISVPITFAGFSLHNDLKSLNADIAIIGVPYESPYLKKQSYSSQNAAATIRQESLRYEKTGNFDFDFNGDLFDGHAIKCVDCGNLINRLEPFDTYLHTITNSIKTLLERGAVPIVIGGDHGTSIPVLKAYEAFQELCVVQIDAHLDWLDERDGVRCGFSSPMRRASELSNVSSIVQIGLRGQGSARQQEVDDARACPKCLLIKAEDLHENGVAKILNRIPTTPYYYLTIDADGLDPSIAPGVGYPTPGGVTYYQLFNIMRGLAKKGKLVGMDFVEVVPENDVVNLTSLFAARQILNFIGVLAHNNQIGS